MEICCSQLAALAEARMHRYVARMGSDKTRNEGNGNGETEMRKWKWRNGNEEMEMVGEAKLVTQIS